MTVFVPPLTILLLKKAFLIPNSKNGENAILQINFI